MPSIQVTGQLVDPTTGVEGSADIRIASLINYGQTTKKSISHKSTDASGNYDFQLVHGKHLILVKFDGEQIYNRIGYAVVGDSTPDPIDIIQLINLSDENPPSELITELQQLREDTLNDIVSTSAEVLENAGYKGLWPDTGGSALKGETYQTQVGGEPTGDYYTALQNTSVYPVGDNVNWKADVNKNNLVLSFDTLSDAISSTDIKDGYLVQLKERTSGNGGGSLWDVVLASTVTPNTRNIVQCTGVTTLALVLKSEGDIDARAFGFILDGTTDNVPVFNDAKTIIGVDNKALYFRNNGVAYFAGSRPDLSGVKIKADDDVTFKVDANPNTKEMTLVSDLNIENTAQQTTYRAHDNQSDFYLASASNALIRTESNDYSSYSFSSGLIDLASIVGVNSKGAFTGTNAGTYLDWSSGFASGQEGAFIDYEHGVLYEAAMRSKGNNSAGGFMSCTAYSSTKRIDLALRASGEIEVINPTSGEAVRSFPSPNGDAFTYGNNSSVILGVRVNDQEVEFYINGVKYHTEVFTDSILECGFLVSSDASTDCQIIELTSTRKLLTGSRPINALVIGDSISYGAWSSQAYDEILKKAFKHSGLGDLSSENVAVSGSSSGQWVVGGSLGIDTYDLSDKDYVFIMLGTNDVQAVGNGAALGLESNLTNICNYIMSEGVTPILAVFPVWTTSSVSGVTGVAAQKYEQGGWARQVVKKVGAKLGVAVTDVCSNLGANIGWYGDNIHPHDRGGLFALAAGFCDAIVNDRQSKRNSISATRSEELALVNGWTAISSCRSQLSNGSVYLTGKITGGADGTVICTLESKYRPTKQDRSFVCWCNDSSGNGGVCRVNISLSGVVSVQFATVTPFTLSLDGIIFNNG